MVGPSVDAVGTIDEFGSNVMRELDYQNEAYNARRVAYNMQTIEGVHVPKIYSQHTSSKVLTMEFIRGVKLNKVEQIDAAGIDRKQLARTFIRAIMKQVLVDGFFHGDPHPGNLMINLDNGVIQFLDLGMVGEMDLPQRISLGDLMFSMQNRDPDGMASALLGVSVPFRADADATAFKKDIERVVTRYMIYADVGASLSEVLSAVMKSLADNGYRLNPNMTLAIKVIVQVEEVMSTLNPEESMIFSAMEEMQVVLKQEITLEKIGDMAKKEATNFVREAVKRLPELQGATLKWLDNYQKGRFEVIVDTSDLSRSVDQLQHQRRTVDGGHDPGRDVDRRRDCAGRAHGNGSWRLYQAGRAAHFRVGGGPGPVAGAAHSVARLPRRTAARRQQESVEDVTRC